MPLKSCPVRRQQGITFIEVMVTVVILSTGLVALYRSFFSAIDYLEYLSARLYAVNLLETRIAFIEKEFRSLKKDIDVGPLAEEVRIGNRPVTFQYAIELKPVGTLLSVFELEIVLSWDSRGRRINIVRNAYFSGITRLTADVPQKKEG